MMNQMNIMDILKHFDNKVPSIRHIDVNIINGKKVPIGEKNNMTPGEIMMNRGNKTSNTLSLSIKYVNDLYCVDFDTKLVNDCDFYKFLNDNNVGYCETTKGYHYYIYIDNIDEYSNEIKVLNQDKPVDLIKKGRNMWEPKDRIYNGDISNVKRFDWNNISHYFNTARMNFISNNIIQEGEPVECAKCSKDELIKYIDNTKIIQRMDNYNDWLMLGMICYNNFDGDDEGFEVWNKYSKQHSGYCGMMELMKKYESFNNERERLVSYKRLLQWNVEDYPCKNEYEQHYKMGCLIEFMNERHAYYEPQCEYFTFDNNGFMRQKENAFKTSMLNKNFMIDDKEINPYKIWITSQERRDIRELVFDPSNNIQDYQYNIWKGYNYANTGDCDISKVQHVLDHIYNIWADGNESTYNYIIGWFAKMLQTPWDKNGICLVLKSIPGVGKTTIVDLFNKIIGNKCSISLSNLKMILGDFNGDAEGKILVNFNETGMWYDKKMSGAFKEFITDEHVTINKKNIQSYTIRNFANCIITTNEDHIVGVSAKDRRFNIIQCSDKLYDDIYYDKLRDTDIQELANYFYNVDISKYNPRKFERSQLFKKQQELSFNSVELFVKDMIECEVYSEWSDEDATIDWNDKEELYNRYTDNCTGTHNHVFNKTHFWIKLNQILPIEYSKPNKGKRQYKLCEYEQAVDAWDKYISRN